MRMLSHLSLLVAGLTIAGSLSAQTPARPMRRGAATTQHMAMAAGGDWTTYGGNLWNQRYFTGTRINAANAAHLTPRFMFQTGTARLGSLETTPLVEDGVMYVTTPYNTAIAYNLKTRKQLWRYEHRLGTTIFCCGPDNRGMAIHGPHVYMGTLDARLVALDKKTGEVAWDVEVADPTFGYSITHAPLVIGNAVIVGVSGGEYGIRGHVTAYDAVTGRQLWRWYSIPAPRGDPTFDAAAPNGWFGSWTPTTPDGADLHRNITQEKSDSARNADAWQRGGGGVWMTPAYDKDLNMIFVAVGNPSPDLDGSIRPGDNLYTDAVVAIDATTGQTKWYYQTVPHDVWDLDAVSPPIVVMVGGKKAIVHAGKTGWVYVLDASNGHLIRRSKNFVPQENMFALPTAAGTRMLPGANGGAEWSPMSVDPTLQYSFVAALHQPMNYITHYAPWEKGRLWLGSAFVAIPNEPQFGIFSAINLQTGEIAWKHQVDQPMMGGALSTAGNLTFTGEGSGKFTAYNSRTGAELWHFDAGAGCNAAPMGFSMDGEDFIAVACGGNFQLNFPLGDAVIVFGLPKAVPPRR